MVGILAQSAFLHGRLSKIIGLPAWLASLDYTNLRHWLTLQSVILTYLHFVVHLRYCTDCAGGASVPLSHFQA